MPPIDLLTRWFTAHASGDLETARSLVDDDLRVVVPGARLSGFDAFMAWFADRVKHEGPSFSYSVDELLGGERHAVALLRITSGDRSWRQVAVYAVVDNRIASIWAVEDDEG